MRESSVKPCDEKCVQRRRVPMCFPSWVKHPELLDKVPNLGTAKPANYVTYVGAPAIEKARVRTHDAHGACDRGA